MIELTLSKAVLESLELEEGSGSELPENLVIWPEFTTIRGPLANQGRRLSSALESTGIRKKLAN